MKTWPIGLIWNSPDPLPEEFPAVAAALQRQVVEHFAPRWGATATVDAFKGIAHVGDRIPIFVQKKLQQRLAGYHLAGARPFARVLYDGGWSVTASHELLELLADPQGNLKQAGPHPTTPGRSVDYLVEICDPCQQVMYALDGVMVSDFVLPAWYVASDRATVPFTFRDSTQRPREVLTDGYVTFWERDGTLLQWNGRGNPHAPDQPDQEVASLRAWVDAHTGAPRPNVAEHPVEADDPYWRRRREDEEFWREQGIEPDPPR
jgi:hypothetical protein